ncbi:MAG: selenocysteine-specific translation elongation factor [Lachnospiraceae bacterium]|nr:selenocysteine-specific translation elongation factor [Lachnospiraceae bacterium]
MKHVIIGSAGHVDHGKTCLIQALTGIDTDRLKEEKERGITIELGFAYLDFPNGQRAGIVDVPGHEKFVKNMLAGAGGMDLAMLVVAADEGVMPQTIEHLDILSILGISGGVIVITKTDLVEPDFLELVIEDVKKLVKGTFLENAPVLPASVYQKKGIEELKSVLQKLCEELPERKDSNTFRMPVDRIFSIKGHGTVVTGTLWEGKIKKEQEAVLYPENEPVRIRGIQVHSCEKQIAFAGQRAAVNLAGRKKESIKRGDILASSGSIYATRMLDVKLTLLKHTRHTVKNASRVHIYLGTQEVLGKVILQGTEELKPGETAYAQLRLEKETAAKKGDYFVIRFYSPVETVGGGTILDVLPKKHRKHDPNVIEAFRIKENGTDEEQLELAFLEQQGTFQPLEELARRYFLNASNVLNQAKKLEKKGKIVCLKDHIYLHREEVARYRKQISEILEAFHRDNPLKEGMGKEELRSRLEKSAGIRTGKETACTDALLQLFTDKKLIKEQNQYYSKYSFHVIIEEDTQLLIQEITNFYQKAGFAPLATEVYMSEHENSGKFRQTFNSLLNKKILIRLNEQYCIHSTYYDQAQKIFSAMAEEQKSPISLGSYRDSLSCSRKVALALLEHFDRSGFTRKMGDGRVLRK